MRIGLVDVAHLYLIGPSLWDQDFTLSEEETLNREMARSPYYYISFRSSDIQAAQNFAQACINIVPNGLLTPRCAAPFRSKAVPVNSVRALEDYDFNWRATDDDGAALINMLCVGGLDLPQMITCFQAPRKQELRAYLCRNGMEDWLNGQR